MPVAELKARLAIRVLPDEDKAIYNALAGLCLAESGHLPVLAEKVWSSGWILVVVDMDGKRIDRILALTQREWLFINTWLHFIKYCELWFLLTRKKMSLKLPHL